MAHQDISGEIQQQVQRAIANQQALYIIGGNSKAFYGGDIQSARELQLAEHSGIIAYEPSELVITARAGCRLADINALLATQQQMLGFEPPTFANLATLGGTLACGFSGPRRPYAGSARDFMLGCKIMNGHGEILTFGGQVMKNVAGFDVSRLMVGAMGSLGIILEVSLRVLPKPDAELSLVFELDLPNALDKMSALASKPWPISALCYTDNRLYVRLSGADRAIRATATQLGGATDDAGDAFWLALREQQLAFFQQSGDLWRLSLAPATPALPLQGNCLYDWGGALRWLITQETSQTIHEVTNQAGGYATCYRGANKKDWIKLDNNLLNLQQNIRNAFDPHRIFNPGRLHP